MSAPAIKVLVIDDEPPIRKLLRMGLTTQGYETLEASNGKVALELLGQNPALIILDLGLPDIQGHELLRMIRGRNDSVPIVVLSSRGDEAGKVLTHKFLLRELWNDLTDSQYLRVYVRQLRQKIEEDPERPQFVLTETGIGYRLRAAD